MAKAPFRHRRGTLSKKALVGFGAVLGFIILVSAFGGGADQSTSVTPVQQQPTVKSAPVNTGSILGEESTQPVVTEPVVNTQPTYVLPEPQPLEGPTYYENTYGDTVQSPTYYDSQPSGATARCRDGTYSFSQSRRGTCSHHGGVAQWL